MPTARSDLRSSGLMPGPAPRRNRGIARSGRSADRRRGAVIVEFALTSSLLFLIVFASIEFMRVNTIVNTVENAAYEGARAGIVPGATPDQVQDAAESVMCAIGIRNAQIAVQPATILENTPEITVTINVPLNDNSFIAPRFFLGKTLTKACTLSREVLGAPTPGAGS